VTGTGGTNV